MLYSTIAQVGFLAMVVACGLAVALGDRWGRLSAVLHAANWVAVYLLQSDATQGLLHPDFLADVVGALLAVSIAMVSGRSWAVVLSTFQILGVLNYLPPLLDRRIHLRTFVTASYVWEAGALISLLAAALDGYLRRRTAAKRRS